MVEKDFNDTSYGGVRVSALFELNEDTSLTVAHTNQRMDTDGVFFTDPDLGDLEIQRYQEDTLTDDFHNTNWTFEGRLGALDALYTGAFTERRSDQTVDYADYLYVGQYIPYYICDYSVSYGSAPLSGTCQAPDLMVHSHSHTQVQTHELRFQTPQDYRYRSTFGAFLSDLELQERNDFVYFGAKAITNWNGDLGFAPNSPFPGGYSSQAGPFPEDTVFRNDILRTDKQFGAFGEFSYDILPDSLTLTLGARSYDVEVDLAGTANSSFCNQSGPNGTDANAFGTDINDLYDGDGEYTFRGDCTTAAHITFDRDDTEASIKSQLEAADPSMTEPPVKRSRFITRCVRPMWQKQRVRFSKPICHGVRLTTIFISLPILRVSVPVFLTVPGVPISRPMIIPCRLNWNRMRLKISRLA